MAEPYIEPHTPLAEYLKEYHHQRGGSGGSAAAVGASSRSSFRKEKGGKMTRGMLGTAFGAGRKVSSSRHQPSSSRSSSVSSSTGSASTGTGAGGAMAYDNAVSSLPSSSAAATQPPGTHSFRCKPIHHTHASSVSRSGDCGNLLRSASATTLEEELGAAAAAEAEVHAAWSEHTLSSSSLASAPSGTSISSQQQELQGLGLRSTSAEVTSPSQPVYVVDQNKDVPPSPLPQHEAPFPTSATQSSTTNILASLPPGSSPRPTPSIPDPNTTASDTSESSEAERDDLHGGDDIENEQGRHRARAWAWDLSAKMPAPPPRPLSVASSKSTRPIGGAASTYADADKQSIMSASGVAVPTIGRKGTTVSLHQSPTFASKGSAGAIATISASALARCSVVSASSSVRSSGQWGDVPSSSNPSSSRVLDFGFGGMEEGEQAWATLSKDRALAAGAASAGAGAGGATAANKRVKPELSARSRGMMPSPKLLDESALSFETITGIGGRSGGDELRKRMSPRASVNTSASRSRSPAREFRSSGVGSLQVTGTMRNGADGEAAALTSSAVAKAPLPMLIKLCRYLADALHMVVRCTLLPLFLSLLSIVLTGFVSLLPNQSPEAHTPGGTAAETITTGENDTDADTKTAASLATAVLDNKAPWASKSMSNAFAEKFKYLICTSFLLTPSLSISFYDEAPPSAVGTAADSSSVSGDGDGVSSKHSSAEHSQRPSSLTNNAQPAAPSGGSEWEHWNDLRKHVNSSTLELEALEARHAGAGTTLPPLSRRGRELRNALIITFFPLAFAADSPSMWFRTVLLLVMTAWIIVIGFQLHDRTPEEESLRYWLSHKSAEAVGNSIYALATKEKFINAASSKLGRAVAREGAAAAKSLVEQLRNWDVEVKKALVAIKEAEVVGRGFKLTHPLPPISRIEASGGSAFELVSSAALSALSSPPRPLASSRAATSRLSRTGSVGREARRQSLSMSSAPSGSTAGRASPSLFDGLPEHDDVTSIRYSALTSYSTTSQMGPSYEGAQSQMRLLPLRKMLARVMDEAEVGCVNISNQLDELVDKEEWELLKEMYSLDGALAVAGMDAKDSLLEGVSTSMDPAADLQSELDALSRPTSSASKAKRLSLLSSSSLLDAETAVSPQTMRSGYKRLSLLANGTKSIESPATSPAAGTSASKRSSVNLEDPLRTSSSIASCGRGTPSLDAQRRTGVGRLAYVHSDTPSNGTDTNYSKRLSYSSSTTSAASFGINNWAALGAGNASVALSQLAPFGDLSFSRDRASSPSMLGRVSPIPGTGGTSLSRVPSQRSGVVMQQPEKSANSIDPLSIAGLQMRHEHVHRTRRKMLVRLLALHFDADASYWRDARGLVASATDLFALLSKDVVKELRAEMGLDAAGKNATDSSLLKPPSQAKVGDLEGHPALEDRLNTMGILLRSIQLKLRACARDLHVKNPPELHGYDADTIVSLSSHQSGLSGTSSWQPTETMFESIKEDLLSLSAEWEGGLNIFNKELKCSASPKPPPAPSSSSPRHPVAGPREFESPQEADEDAWQEQDQGLTGVITMEDSSPLADHDLMDLVKQSTDPQYLPPPGLEQVFESIAGLVDFDPASAKVGLSRDERIARVREQRAKKLAEQQSQPKPADGAGKTVVISELKDVIAQIKQKRQLPASEDQEKKLGSPLEIDDPVIQQTGRFSSLACDVRSGSRSGSTSASTTPDLMQWPMQNAASFPQPSSRLRTPSSGSDSMGKSSRRQSQAINGLVSGVGSEVYGTWDPSDTTRSTLLESVSEGTESQSVEVTPTTAVHNLPRTKPSQTGVPSGIPVSTSSTSMKSASSAVSFGPANSHSLAQVMKLSHNARAGSRHVHRIGSGPSVVRRDSLDDAQPAQQPQLQPQSQELQSLTGQQAQRPVPVGSAF